MKNRDSNKHLKTKFDPDISMAGFDFIKDLFPENQPINGSDKLSDYKRRKLLSILAEVPGHWKNKIMSAAINKSPSKHNNVGGENSSSKRNDICGNNSAPKQNKAVGNKSPPKLNDLVKEKA